MSEPMLEGGSSPRLPPLYELVTLPSADSVLDEGRRRAAGGADEGTMIWTREQTAARTRNGEVWNSPDGNLHCALIVRPDYPNAVAGQLAYVMAVAAGDALAGLIAPMVELRYRWPGDILLDGLRTAHITLAAADTGTDPYEWLVLALMQNVAYPPPSPEPHAYNSIHASGAPEVTPVQALEQFARYFLLWINRWAEEGFAPVAKAWRRLGNKAGDAMSIGLGGEVLSGRFADLDSDGRLLLDREGGSRRVISVADVFALGSSR